jgi:tetratricopeptide (TPR) repeat protein
MTDALLPVMTDTPAQHREAAQRAREAGDELGALAHLIAAEALQTAQAHETHEVREGAARIGTVATGYFMKGDHARAQRWYELALNLDAAQAPAWQNLAAIHAKAERHDLADGCRERAYALQRVYVEVAGQPARRVLLLCAGRSAGNVPFDLLVPVPQNGRIKYAIDYAAPEEDASLPPFDLVFNAVGDPDIAGPLAERLARFAQTCPRPLLNAPARVAATRRDRLPALLSGLADVRCAPCIRVEDADEAVAQVWERAHAADMHLPLLVRPVATHGGEGLVRCDTHAQFDAALAAQSGPYYVSAFHDTRDADGACRKYRAAFVDRVPYPYHLAISPHWMVHYFSAGMEGVRWKLDEEARFLADPAAALGARGAAAIAAIGRRLDLDYAGVDFTVLPDGSIFVFEANATMLVHRERPDGELAHKNAYVERIGGAFETMMRARTAAA